MKIIRLTRIERRLMEAEYLLDSTNTHVRMKKCDDVRPLALRRYTQALNALRGALDMVRREQGLKHPTLFAGVAGRDGLPQTHALKTGVRVQTQKTWHGSQAHGWKKDCDP